MRLYISFLVTFILCWGQFSKHNIDITWNSRLYQLNNLNDYESIIQIITKNHKYQTIFENIVKLFFNSNVNLTIKDNALSAHITGENGILEHKQSVYANRLLSSLASKFNIKRRSINGKPFNILYIKLNQEEQDLLVFFFLNNLEFFIYGKIIDGNIDNQDFLIEQEASLMIANMEYIADDTLKLDPLNIKLHIKNATLNQFIDNIHFKLQQINNTLFKQLKATLKNNISIPFEKSSLNKLTNIPAWVYDNNNYINININPTKILELAKRYTTIPHFIINVSKTALKNFENNLKLNYLSHSQELFIETSVYNQEEFNLSKIMLQGLLNNTQILTKNKDVFIHFQENNPSKNTKNIFRNYLSSKKFKHPEKALKNNKNVINSLKKIGTQFSNVHPIAISIIDTQPYIQKIFSDNAILPYLNTWMTGIWYLSQNTIIFNWVNHK